MHVSLYFLLMYFSRTPLHSGDGVVVAGMAGTVEGLTCSSNGTVASLAAPVAAAETSPSMEMVLIWS